jgi:hypothetical protein
MYLANGVIEKKEKTHEQPQNSQRFRLETMSIQRSTMYLLFSTTTSTLSQKCIEEVNTVASSKFELIEQVDEEVSLIESFSQPFPLRERDQPVMDREMDSYG